MSLTSTIIPLLAQASPSAGDQLLGMLVPLGLIFLVFYFVMWRPQAKRQREHDAYLNALKSGDEVVTVGGMFGTVRSIEDSVVTLEVSKGTKIEILKSQIRGSRDSVLGTGDSNENSDS